MVDILIIIVSTLFTIQKIIGCQQCSTAIASTLTVVLVFRRTCLCRRGCKILAHD